MSFSESLTVRILGDSSGLQTELDSVLERLDELNTRFSESAESAEQLTSSLSSVSQAVRPLQQVSSMLSRIDQQLRAISQMPITLNVTPALQALQQLTMAARMAAAAIQAIPAIPIGGGGPGPGVGPAPGPIIGPTPAGPRQRYAGGGLVTGPSGIDRVSTQLTAGEFVLSRQAVETLGLGMLNRLNSIRASPRLNRLPAEAGSSVIRSLQPPAGPSMSSLRSLLPRSSSAAGPPSGSPINNHFGGITIQVSDQIETESLLRTMQLQGLSRHIRQG